MQARLAAAHKLYKQAPAERLPDSCQPTLRSRAAEAAAEALAARSPTLPAAGGGLDQVQAGCAAALLLLTALTLSKGQGLASPAAAYRLAGCAGLALGPGLAAVQAAQQHAVDAPAELQQALATSVAGACRGLLAMACQAQQLVEALGERQPGPALRATTCKRGRLVGLCLACAPVLSCWRGRLGELAPSEGAAKCVPCALLARSFKTLTSRQQTAPAVQATPPVPAPATEWRNGGVDELAQLLEALSPFAGDERAGEGGLALLALLPEE